MLKGWRLKPIIDRDPQWVRHVSDMADLIRKDGQYNKRVAIPDGADKESFIAQMQAGSTQKLLELHKDPGYVRDWSAPLPDNVLANPDAKNRDDLVGKRELSIEEIGHFEAVRRRPKNSRGQSELSSVTPEKVENAIHHFEVSPPAPTPEDGQRITQLQKVEPYQPPKQVWRTLTWWQALKAKVSGREVIKINRDNTSTWGEWVDGE